MWSAIWNYIIQLNCILVIYSSITVFSWFQNICYYKEYCYIMLLLYQCARPLNAWFYVSLSKYSIFLYVRERNGILKRLSNFPNVTQLDQDQPQIWNHVCHSSLGCLLPHCLVWSRIPWFSYWSHAGSKRAQGEKLATSFNPCFSENSGKLWVSNEVLWVQKKLGYGGGRPLRKPLFTALLPTGLGMPVLELLARNSQESVTKLWNRKKWKSTRKSLCVWEPGKSKKKKKNKTLMDVARYRLEGI